MKFLKKTRELNEFFQRESKLILVYFIFKFQKIQEISLIFCFRDQF